MTSDALGQATRGLVNMGFAKKNVERALVDVVARHAGEAVAVPVVDLLREAIAALAR